MPQVADSLSVAREREKHLGLVSEAYLEGDHNAEFCRLLNSSVKCLLPLAAVWSGKQRRCLCQVAVRVMFYTGVWQPAKLSIVIPLQVLLWLVFSKGLKYKISLFVQDFYQTDGKICLSAVLRYQMFSSFQVTKCLMLQA